MLATPSSGASTSRAGQVAPRTGGQQGMGTPQDRVFTVAATATPPDPSVVRGTFLVFSSWARVLLDMETSHSFIAASFSTALGLETDTLDPPLYVDTPIGGRVLLDRVCRGCDLTIAERTFVFDFIVLDMTAFDVILGMDWLSSVRAVIDCYQRRVTICTGDGDCFRFFGDRLDIIDPMLSRRRDQTSIVCMLAGLSVSDREIVPIVLPRVVCEFADVFPDELPGLPPVREIDFCIDLVPGTGPISMAPYRFAPAELIELKKQLL